MNFTTLTNQLNSNNMECSEWEYLPEPTVDCLSEYLTNCDLIEFSKLSTWYRIQLKSQILNSLTIFKSQKLLLDSYGLSLDKKIKFKLVLEDMKRDLMGSYNYVKELKIFATIPVYFISELVKVFSYVERVCIIGEGKYSEKGLIPILKGLNSLKHIKLSLNDLIKNSDIELLLNFSQKLNTVEIDIFWDFDSRLYSSFVSSFKFNNLTKLTIFYLSTLTSFPLHLPSLVHVELLDYSVPDIDNGTHVSFLQNNQQLKSLIISGRILNLELINLILSFRNLNYLEIIHSLNTQVLNNNNNIELVNNHSINHLKLYENFQSKALNIFLYHCRSLKTLEFDNLKYQSELNLQLLSSSNLPKINQLILKNRPWSKNPPLPRSILDYFNIVLLINWQEIRKFKQKTLINLDGWKLREFDYSNSRNYYIERDLDFMLD